jgi:hypothetical protein
MPLSKLASDPDPPVFAWITGMHHYAWPFFNFLFTFAQSK